MTEVPRPVPAEPDTGVANIARINDYLLGGKDNFAADRDAAESLLAIAPEIKDMAVENRAFLGRAVRFLAGAGIRQFIDVGAGLPTNRNTHDVVRSVPPAARTVYVDKDPVVLSHARAILVDDERNAVIEGDILHPAELLASCRMERLIDFDEPVAVLICGALHFIPHSDDPFKAVALLCDALPSGSYLAISHVAFDDHGEQVEPIEEIYRALLNRPGEHAARTRAEVASFFDGLELVEPGLVYLKEWRPDNPLNASGAEKVWMLGGVGRKP